MSIQLRLMRPSTRDVSGAMCVPGAYGLGPLAVMEGVLTEVQMKPEGSRGHGQTVMKQQCDLQLAGPIMAEQKSPHETSLKTSLPFQIWEVISVSLGLFVGAVRRLR